jgi:hypothetical protein
MTGSVERTRDNRITKGGRMGGKGEFRRPKKSWINQE